MDGRSENFKRIENAYKKDKILQDTKPFILPSIDIRLENNQKLLELEKYSSIVKEYERTKKVLNKNPDWYNLFNGPRKIEQLANRLGYNTYYEILYRQWSSSTHGTAIIQGKIHKNTNFGVDILQIRLPNEAQIVTTFCINLSTYLFRTYIHKRLPNKNDEFKSWIQGIQPIFKALETRNLIKLI